MVLDESPVVGPVSRPLVFIAFTFIALSAARRYAEPVILSIAREGPRLLGAISFATVAFYAVMTPVVGTGPSLTGETLLWGAAIGCLLLSGAIHSYVLRTLNRHGIGYRKLLVVGNTANSLNAIRRLSHDASPYEVIGYVNVNGSRAVVRSDEALLGDLEDLPAVIDAYGPCEVLIADPIPQRSGLETALRANVPVGTRVHLAMYPPLDELPVQKVDGLDGGIFTAQLKVGAFPWHYEVVKRLIDLILTLMALIVAAPLMLLIGIAIKVDSPGPILFRQLRVGRQGRQFYMYKFRSMHQNASEMLEGLQTQNEARGAMFKIKNDPRITRMGRVIRRLSLDELPQLFNVLEGTMSLVGPRPPLPHELEQYEPWQLRRLEAVPGITGLWQTSRGDEIIFEEMVQMDLEYIEEWSLGLDLKIMLKTIPAMLSGRGAF
ncbi:MAG: sugar transferase [Chloroflexi bacterium]|nr:sugar transferase [Chloroflexota bacterium]